MDYRVFDLETENHKHRKRVASQFCPQNWVVAYGWKDRGDSEPSGLYYPHFTDVLDSEWDIPDNIDLLVGHNIKFDLLWVWKHPSMRRFIERGGRIWCTQLAEYILEAQEQAVHWNSLNDLAPKYGGTTKFDAVKQMWESGMLTSQIPEDILMEYLLGGTDRAGDGDIGNTEKVFLGQLRRATEKGVVHTLMNRMESLIATTEMEYNGLYVDVELGRSIAAKLTQDLTDLDTKLNSQLPDLPEEFTFNWGSAYHVSALLFGGSVPYTKWVQHRCPLTNELLYANTTIKEPILDEQGNPTRFKSGKRAGEIRTRNITQPDLSKPKGAQQEFLHKFAGLVKPLEEWSGKRNLRCGTPVYSTNSDVIDYLVGHGLGEGLPSLLRDRAKLDKDLGTYYVKYDSKKDEYTGMLTLVGDDGILHGQLNHVATVTSRMSSSDPNLQNIPRGDTSDIKKVFRSRWANGKMVEIDYSQLEVIIQAWLTGDKQMIEDVINGVDFHCKRLAAQRGESYDFVKSKVAEKVEEYCIGRTHIKGFTFQRAYGAGAPAIAASTGMSVEQVEELIANEDKLYPGVSAFDQRVEKSITDSAIVRRETDPLRPYTHRPYLVGEWQAPTGTSYRWRQWEAPAYLRKKGITMTFSPTERKNWPVQGTGGEIMQMTLGRLFRKFVQMGWWSQGDKGNEALLVNTVHDCAWFEAIDTVVETMMDVAMEVFQNVPKHIKETFNVDVPVPFRAEAEYGDTMYDVEHYHYTGTCPLAA